VTSLQKSLRHTRASIKVASLPHRTSARKPNQPPQKHTRALERCALRLQSLVACIVFADIPNARGVGNRRSELLRPEMTIQRAAACTALFFAGDLCAGLVLSPSRPSEVVSLPDESRPSQSDPPFSLSVTSSTRAPPNLTVRTRVAIPQPEIFTTKQNLAGDGFNHFASITLNFVRIILSVIIAATVLKTFSNFFLLVSFNVTALVLWRKPGCLMQEPPRYNIYEQQ